MFFFFVTLQQLTDRKRLLNFRSLSGPLPQLQSVECVLYCCPPTPDKECHPNWWGWQLICFCCFFCRRQSTWFPASLSVGGEQEHQLKRVHKTTLSGAKSPWEFNQGGPFVVRSFPVPGVPFPEMLTPVLARLARGKASWLLFVFLWSEKLLKGT